MTKNNWLDLYNDAILEQNVAVAKVRLQAAEEAIMTRALNPRVSQEERREMGKALFTIRRLKKVD